MTYKWFLNIKTLDELRTTYRKLALLHHPDIGGKTIDMQEINHEYELLSKILINSNSEFSEGRKWYENKVSEEIKDKINEIITLPGVMIEIIGSWLWVSGNTKAVRDELKAAGFRFASDKFNWYWQCGNYRKRNGILYTMDEIREIWGVEKVNSKPSNQFINIQN